MKIEGKIALGNLGTPNKNGRIYSEEVIKNAIDDCDSLKNKRLFITNGFKQTVEVDLSDVVGIVDELYIKDNNLIANVSYLIEDDMCNYKEIRPCGVGNVDKDGVISNYQLLSFALTSDPA